MVSRERFTRIKEFLFGRKPSTDPDERVGCVGIKPRGGSPKRIKEYYDKLSLVATSEELKIIQRARKKFEKRQTSVE